MCLALVLGKLSPARDKAATAVQSQLDTETAPDYGIVWQIAAPDVRVTQLVQELAEGPTPGWKPPPSILVLNKVPHRTFENSLKSSFQIETVARDHSCRKSAGPRAARSQLITRLAGAHTFHTLLVCTCSISSQAEDPTGLCTGGQVHGGGPHICLGHSTGGLTEDFVQL